MASLSVIRLVAVNVTATASSTVAVSESLLGHEAGERSIAVLSASALPTTAIIAAYRQGRHRERP